MSRYNYVEKIIAKKLDSFPMVKKISRNLYQRAMYVIHRKKNFQVELNNNVNLFCVDSQYENFFGYYDKSPWNTEMNKYLINRIFNDKLLISVVDLKHGGIQDIAETSTWNYQQGAMLQWISNTSKVIFNDISNEQIISRIIDLNEKKEFKINYPIQTIHPLKKRALGLNYKRLFKLRPEYGYQNQCVNLKIDEDDSKDGIFLIDLENGIYKLIISLSILKNNYPRDEMKNSSHKVNHIMYSRSGKRFVFMHRWLGPNGKFSRLYVADQTGDNLKLLLDDRMVSHYQWKDDEHLLVWARTKEYGDKYYLINVVTGERKIIGEGILDKYGDGHPSFSPDGRWIVTDTYPDKARIRHLLLYDTKNNELHEIGKFFSPWKFNNEKRCDLHPRWSPDGNFISIDSTHEGKRRNYIIDVSRIVRGE